LGTKVLRYQNQELIHYDQVLKGEAVTLFNREGVKYEKKRIVPQEGGIYSDQIGSLIEDTADVSEYSCSPTCRHLVGRIWEGTECPVCHQIVKNNFTVSFDKNGWINIGTHKVIQPAAFAKVRDLIGDKNLDDIINFNDNLDLQGNIIIGNSEINKKHPYSKIGMTEFYKKFDEIVLFYGKQKHKMEDAEFLLQFKNRIWTSKINVLAQALRPAFINSSEKTFRFDSINTIYSTIINNASLIAKAEITDQYMNINKYLYTIQMELFTLYGAILQKLDGKKKLPRRKIQGTKVSWSSRMVITANTGENYGIDHIVISYKAFLELYIYEIMNCFKRGVAGVDYFVNRTLYEIAEWLEVEKYSNRVHPAIYKVMKWLIDNNEDGLYCLVNRPPTMDIGSLQMLRVVDVLPNACEYHMEVPLTSLVAWNADFDGDTLSLYSIKEKNIVEAFNKGFNPRSLIVNKVSSYKVYNSAFGLPKDLAMFLYSFVPEESHKFRKPEFKGA
jgi:DNA-directed RNA polymerase beta' subunit